MSNCHWRWGDKWVYLRVRYSALWQTSVWICCVCWFNISFAQKTTERWWIPKPDVFVLNKLPRFLLQLHSTRTVSTFLYNISLLTEKKVSVIQKYFPFSMIVLCNLMQSNILCSRYSKTQGKSDKGVTALHQGESLFYFWLIFFGEASHKTSKAFYLFFVLDWNITAWQVLFPIISQFVVFSPWLQMSHKCLINVTIVISFHQIP